MLLSVPVLLNINIGNVSKRIFLLKRNITRKAYYRINRVPITLYLIWNGETKKEYSPPGGLEPPTFRLTAERASRLRHRDIAGGFSILFKQTSATPPGKKYIYFCNKRNLPMPGIEPGPSGWKPEILTTRPHWKLKDVLKSAVEYNSTSCQHWRNSKEVFQKDDMVCK